MDHDHVTFAGLELADMSERELQAMQLGFMWNALIEFVNQVHFERVRICLHERFGAAAMQMGDKLMLGFQASDGCRGEQIHVVYWRKAE